MTRWMWLGGLAGLALLLLGGVLLWLRRPDGAPPRTSYAPLPGESPAAAPLVTAPVSPVGPSAQDRRSRYGVNLSQADASRVQALGLEWFIPCCSPDYTPPPGTRIPQRLFFAQPGGRDAGTLRTRVLRWPGAYWFIDNEPNVPEMGNLTPEAYAEALAWAAGVIKAADPTAKLVGPHVLNWSVTCERCAGYTEGRAWTEAMRAVYLARYEQEPPFDVWALHIYDVDWSVLPQGNAERQINQVRGLREWLDSHPGLRDRPIWLTETGILWGYPAIEWRDGLAAPAGAFAHDHVERYMRTLFGWLEANAAALSIERWFLWSVWQGRESWNTAFGGITLVEGPQPNASITPLGRLYQELAGIR